MPSASDSSSRNGHYGVTAVEISCFVVGQSGEIKLHSKAISGSLAVASCKAFVVGEVKLRFSCFANISTSTRKTSNPVGVATLGTEIGARESVSASANDEPFLYLTFNLYLSNRSMIF